MANAGEGLQIAVGANIRALERQMKAAGAVAERAASDIEGRFNKLNPGISTNALTGALKGLGAVVAAVSLERIARGVIEANREIASFAQTSRQAGIELQRFQELRFAAGSKGIGGKEFDGGLTGLSDALNKARNEETELSRLFDANGLKLKDRNGTVISTNEALSHAADLISRAATESDKVDIAAKFGIPKDFVPLLENGSAALDQLAQNARDAGAVLSDDVIAKAKQFDDAWNGAWNSFITATKAAVTNAAVGLGDLIKQADEFQKRMAAARGAGGALGRQIATMAAGGQPTTAPLPPTRPDGTPVTAPYPPSRPGRGYIGADVTRNPSKSSGGGGSGGKSEEEQRYDQVQNYIQALEKVNRVLEAEKATLGKSKAERAAAIELARIGAVEDDGQRQKIEQIVKANEALRESIEKIKKAQKDANEAARYFGDALTDAFSDAILEGEKLDKVAQNLVKSLARAALQAALMGSGPLGGFFGTAGTNGAPGGVFGLIGGMFKGGGGTGGLYDDGGFTGRGGKYEPAGIVHKGEYVFSAAAVKKLGLGRLEAMHRGFSSGGAVGMSSLPPGLNAGGNGKPSVNVNVVNNAGVGVETQQQSNGDITVMISAIEARIADNMLRGRGPLSAANNALRTNRHLR